MIIWYGIPTSQDHVGFTVFGNIERVAPIPLLHVTISVTISAKYSAATSFHLFAGMDIPV